MNIYENVAIKTRVEDSKRAVRGWERGSSLKIQKGTLLDKACSMAWVNTVLLSRPLTSQIADLVRSNRNRADNRRRATILHPVQDRDLIEFSPLSTNLFSTSFSVARNNPIEYLFKSRACKNNFDYLLCRSLLRKLKGIGLKLWVWFVNSSCLTLTGFSSESPLIY